MPEMDGITASRTVKQELRDQAPYIIACTADLQYDTRTACAQAGIDNYLEKVHARNQPSCNLSFHVTSRPRCLASSYSPEHSLSLLAAANQAQGLGQGVGGCGHQPRPAKRSRSYRLVSKLGLVRVAGACPVLPALARGITLAMPSPTT
jgi:CheY-like chemotaxis protein